MLEKIAELVQLLEEAKVSYCVIGGIAVLLYGGRASTIDFDFYILATDKDGLEKLFDEIGLRYRQLGEDQLKGKFRGMPVDVLIADQWIGAAALKRAKKIRVGDLRLRVATPEDLIVMKTISDRPIDRRDVAELRECMGSKINEKYVSARIKKIQELTRS